MEVVAACEVACGVQQYAWEVSCGEDLGCAVRVGDEVTCEGAEPKPVGKAAGGRGVVSHAPAEAEASGEPFHVEVSVGGELNPAAAAVARGVEAGSHSAAAEVLLEAVDRAEEAVDEVAALAAGFAAAVASLGADAAEPKRRAMAARACAWDPAFARHWL